jgi:hypothetical protein
MRNIKKQYPVRIKFKKPGFVSKNLETKAGIPGKYCANYGSKIPVVSRVKTGYNPCHSRCSIQSVRAEGGD